MIGKRFDFRPRRAPPRNIMGAGARNSAAGDYFLDEHLFKLWLKHGSKSRGVQGFAKFAAENGIGTLGVNVIRLKLLLDAGKIKFTPQEKTTNSDARKLILGEMKGKRYKNKELAVRELSEELRELNPKFVKMVLDELILEGIVSLEQIATDAASQAKLRKSLARQRATK